MEGQVPDGNYRIFVQSIFGARPRELLTEKLYSHFLEIDESANERMNILMPQLMRAAGVPQEQKAADEMKWVRL